MPESQGFFNGAFRQTLGRPVKLGNAKLLYLLNCSVLEGVSCMYLLLFMASKRQPVEDNVFFAKT
jgi:hypothetical protein